MNKLLFLYERNMPTISIMKDMFVGLSSDYGFQSEVKNVLNITENDINQSDVIVFMRPNDVLSASLAKKAKNSGRFIITFSDDDLLKHKPMMPWRLKALKDTLKLSEVFWSSNSYLIKQYVKLTSEKRFANVDTIVRDEQIENYSPHRNDKVKIVYAANPSHVISFDKFIRPAFSEIVEKYGDKISFTFVSVHPELKEFEGKAEINYVKGMPLFEYRNFMAEEKFDIGLSPLNDDEFTRCKYFNKYIEYSMSGICGVYSDILLYRNAIKNGENGFLAENTKEGWMKALGFAIENQELREKCIINAQKDLHENFSEQSIINKLIKDIPELVKCEKNKTNCKSFKLNKIIYYCYRPLDWAYLMIFYLRNGGIKRLTEKIKIHFREKGIRQ